MCGIAGFIDFNLGSSKAVLEQMTDTMLHRGPDGAGYEVFTMENCQIGFGHRRLAIIDLTESGRQPMSYGQLHITYNGEVYNFQEIKAELLQLGHQFRGASDTEVMLHAYQEWGEQCVDKFIGMFAFVLLDEAKQRIFCVRDRAGVKPFYYYWKDGLFLFASELKALHAHPKFEKKINQDAVGLFLKYGNVPAPYCIFDNCLKLEAGHHLTIDLNSRKQETKQYWNVYDSYNQPKLTIDFEEAKQETSKILESAFNYRMVADVPVGVFLSGGYDSVAVTSLLQKNRTTKLKTYTIGMPDIGLNEAPFAKEIAEHLGTEHTEYYCTEKDAFEIIDDLPFYYDEPFADSSAIPTILVCKIARQEVTVALSADAGDEIFAGYNRYEYLMNYGKKLNAIPKIFRKTGYHLMNFAPNQLNASMGERRAGQFKKLKKLLNDPSPTQLMHSLSALMDEEELTTVFGKKVNPLRTNFDSQELKAAYRDDLSYLMAIDYETYLTDDILQKVDRAGMSVSLEGREPFLDQRIIEWAAQLPSDYKYHKGIKKYILKEIVHDYVPQSMLDRPKMGFGIPKETWLRNDLKEKVLHFLDKNLIEQQGIFNTDYVEKLVARFMAGQGGLDDKVWYLLMFQMWYQRWM